MEESSASSSSSFVEKRNWSELPSHLLDIIMDKLSSPQFLSDYIRFGAVCDSWNSAFCDHDPPPSHQFPTLLLLTTVPPPPPPPTLNNKKKTRLRLRRLLNKILSKTKTWRLSRFYYISDEKMEDVTVEQVIMPSYRRCRGSSHGWLITVDREPLSNYDNDFDDFLKLNFAIRLFNPFLSTNGFEILLPSLTTVDIFPVSIWFSGYVLPVYPVLETAALSANPLTNPTDYTLMAVYNNGSNLAFFKPGCKRWQHIEPPEIQGSKLGNFTDIIYMYGKFYVVTFYGALVVVAVSDIVKGEQQGKGMIAKLVIPPLPQKVETCLSMEYLIVESSGRELLKVHRFCSPDQGIGGERTNATTGFRVFKLKVTTGGAKEEEEYKWQEVKSLCGDSIFLGHNNTSISIRASDYPGCKPNSIHYTDDSADVWDAQQDIGIFNLEDGSFKRRYLPLLTKKIYDTIWIRPSLPNKNRRKRSSSSC